PPEGIQQPKAARNANAHAISHHPLRSKGRKFFHLPLQFPHTRIITSSSMASHRATQIISTSRPFPLAAEITAAGTATPSHTTSSGQQLFPTRGCAWHRRHVVYPSPNAAQLLM